MMNSGTRHGRTCDTLRDAGTHAHHVSGSWVVCLASHCVRVVGSGRACYGVLAAFIFDGDVCTLNEDVEAAVTATTVMLYEFQRHQGAAAFCVGQSDRALCASPICGWPTSVLHLPYIYFDISATRATHGDMDAISTILFSRGLSEHLPAK